MTELAEVARTFRAHADGRATRRDLEAALHRKAGPLATAVRAAIGQIPARGGKSTGLRRRMAAAVTTRSWAAGDVVGATVSVDGSKMPAGQRALPAYMEGVRPRWRHPVYGTDRWVDQQARPFFYRTVRRRGQAAAKAAVDETLADLAADLGNGNR